MSKREHQAFMQDIRSAQANIRVAQDSAADSSDQVISEMDHLVGPGSLGMITMEHARVAGQDGNTAGIDTHTYFKHAKHPTERTGKEAVTVEASLRGPNEGHYNIVSSVESKRVPRRFGIGTRQEAHGRTTVTYKDAAGEEATVYTSNDTGRARRTGSFIANQANKLAEETRKSTV